MRPKLTKKTFLKLTFGLAAFLVAIVSLVSIPKADNLDNGSLGIVSFINSLPSNQDKQAMIGKIQKAGFTWVREEYTYILPMNYVPFDLAYEKIVDANLNILGLLTYPGPDKSHDVWKQYVTDVITRYPEVKAWEIMNEADNYLSAADYTVYLKEASEIIRAKTDAKIVATGVTARLGANQFWDGINQAGGWNYFDAVGLHIYHQGDPYKAENDYGTFADEMKKVGENIQKNGGNKRIWITEFGYDTNDYGMEKQAKWLVDSLSIMRAMPQVEQVFVFRLYEHDNGLGLLNSSFAEKPSFEKVAQWIRDGAPATKVNLFPKKDEVAVLPPVPVEIDKEKTTVRVLGENISPDGQEQFVVAVSLSDKNGQPVIAQKPDFEIKGASTAVTDFTLAGDEWVSYVASTEAGEKTVDIKIANEKVATAKMVFGVTEVPEPSPVPEVVTETSSVVPDSVANSVDIMAKPAESVRKRVWVFALIESIIIFFIWLVSYALWQRTRNFRV